MSFFIFCIIQAPIVLISPEKLRHFFTLKSFVTPIGLIAFLAWNVSGANGLGPIISQPAMVKGSELGWAFVGSTADALNNSEYSQKSSTEENEEERGESVGQLISSVSLPILKWFSSLSTPLILRDLLLDLPVIWRLFQLCLSLLPSLLG